MRSRLCSAGRSACSPLLYCAVRRAPAPRQAERAGPTAGAFSPAQAVQLEPAQPFNPMATDEVALTQEEEDPMLSHSAPLLLPGDPLAVLRPCGCNR
mmetsp:Transcript_69351/g.159283  ORF Transcript_69351/g.159283 Transcript_69351/m.159283 type:complete len:97 (-) Transcript_69351:435-725(-)